MTDLSEANRILIEDCAGLRQRAQTLIEKTRTIFAESSKLFAESRGLYAYLLRRRSGAQILLIHNDTIRRADLADDLREHGYKVFQAGDVIEALTLLAKHRIDLVITDVNLPEPPKVPVIKLFTYKDAGKGTASRLVGLVEHARSASGCA